MEFLLIVLQLQEQEPGEFHEHNVRFRFQHESERHRFHPALNSPMRERIPQYPQLHPKNQPHENEYCPIRLDARGPLPRLEYDKFLLHPFLLIQGVTNERCDAGYLNSCNAHDDCDDLKLSPHVLHDRAQIHAYVFRECRIFDPLVLQFVYHPEITDSLFPKRHSAVQEKAVHITRPSACHPQFPFCILYINSFDCPPFNCVKSLYNIIFHLSCKFAQKEETIFG